MVILILLIGIKRVQASQLYQEHLSNVYSVYVANDRTRLFEGEIYKMDGRVVYCIEPGTRITTSFYNVTEDTSMMNMSGEVLDYVKKVAYFGYDYINHNDYRYYLAAQELIWEKITGREVYFVNELDINGNRINVDGYKEEIINLINVNDKSISFVNNKIVKFKGDTLILEDYNNVLGDYEVIGSGAYILGNKLIITDDITSLSLKKKMYTDEIFLLYYNGNSQKMVSSGKLDNRIVDIDIELTGGILSISKYGEKMVLEDNSYHYEKISLSNIVFKVRADSDIVTSDGIMHYKKDDIVGELITDDGGQASIKLYYGSYCLSEENSDNNYVNNYEECFLFDEDKQLEINNYLKKGKLVINKIDNDTLEGLSGVTFNLYDEDKKLITTKTTNDLGKIVIDDLKLGKYYLKEITSKEGYWVSDEVILIDINKNNKTYDVNITNKKIIEIPKTGIKTYNIGLIMIIINIIGFILFKDGFKKI